MAAQLGLQHGGERAKEGVRNGAAGEQLLLLPPQEQAEGLCAQQLLQEPLEQVGQEHYQ